MQFLQIVQNQNTPGRLIFQRFNIIWIFKVSWKLELRRNSLHEHKKFFYMSVSLIIAFQAHASAKLNGS